MKHYPLRFEHIKAATAEVLQQHTSIDNIFIPDGYFEKMREQVDVLQLDTWTQPQAQLKSIVNVTVLLTIESMRFQIGQADIAPEFGLALALAWLTDTHCSLRPEVEVRNLLTQFRRCRPPTASYSINYMTEVWRRSIVDSLLVFVASPITGTTTDEANMLSAMNDQIADELRLIGVRTYLAINEADPRIHRDFADDPRWRDTDEPWILQSDVAVILHTRAATGLGCVAEIAHSAQLPIFVGAIALITPLLSGLVDDDKLLLLDHTFPASVAEYLLEHIDSLKQHRLLVQDTWVPKWRARRNRLVRRLSSLSSEGLVLGHPTTMSKPRFDQILGDDYAFGAASNFELAEISRLIGQPVLAELSEDQRRALEQAARNHSWTLDTTWIVEAGGRELIAEGFDNPAVLSHRTNPISPKFWESVHGEIYS